MIKKEKRHKKVVMSFEAIALREIRIEKGLSMREVCKALNKSEAFLRHIETGRRDFPKKIVLETILNVLGVTYKIFRHKVVVVEAEAGKLGPREELKRMIDRLAEDKVAVVMSVVKSLL